jgi:hypothetical protein
MKKIEFLANLKEPWRQPTLLQQGMTFLKMVRGFLLRKVILGTLSLLAS